MNGKLEILNVLGVWISGFATLFVGIIALLTSRRKLKPLLDVSVNFGNMMGVEPQEEFIYISISNISEFPVYINSIFWRFPCSKNYALQMVSYDDPRSHQLPKFLEPGHQGLFLINWSVFKENIVQLFKNLNIKKEKDILNMKIVLSTSVGNKEYKVNSSLKNEILEMFKHAKPDL